MNAADQTARPTVHVALAPADGGYDALEVDPWPHIHLDPKDDGTILVTLSRYKGHWPDEAIWYIHVQPPRLARIWGDSLDRRIDRAIETLQRRWDQRVADAHAAYVATRRTR